MSVPFVVLRRFLSQAAEGHPCVFTKEKIMRKRFVGNYVKVAVIAVSLAVASSCALAGTFAAFSATYTWSAESGEAGDVAYRDTVFSLDLFGDGYILPGDEGSAELGGVDLDGADVAWRFEIGTAEDDRVIPVVFYISEDGNPDPDTYYSAYNFSERYGGYLSVGGNYIPASSVSMDATGITSALGTGKSVCWAWPDTIYTDQNGTVDEVALKDYQAYCAKVCDVSYAYTTETFGEIFDAEGVKFVGYATGVDGDNIIFANTAVEVDSSNNVLKPANGGNISYEKFGRFDAITSSGDLDADTVAWLIVAESSTGAGLAGIEAQLTELGAEICGKYRIDGDVLIPDESGNRTLVKLPPVQTGVRASVSVTVSAVVTF